MPYKLEPNFRYFLEKHGTINSSFMYTSEVKAEIEVDESIAENFKNSLAEQFGTTVKIQIKLKGLN